MEYFSLFVSIIVCVVFGIITRKMNEAKGYEGGFWWGFFLTWIGVIVVAVKPDIRGGTYANGVQQDSALSRYAAEEKNNERIKNQGGWECPKCKRVNAGYVTTCICGMTSKEALSRERNKQTVNVQQASNADELKKFKELLDMGVISEEEFNSKKKELLGL